MLKNVDCLQVRVKHWNAKCMSTHRLSTTCFISYDLHLSIRLRLYLNNTSRTRIFKYNQSNNVK